MASEPDGTHEPEDDRHDKVDQVDLQLEMQRSYLDYAMSVIVGRALPDVRDGLKPVHRRVIYAMYDGGYRPDKGFSKCTRVIGEVMGQFHPHGDSSVYDALVRLVQPWSLRYPLALGQGNFGSAGNDGAAAHRYTETKMAPLAMEMVRDIDEDTVDFQDNYDGRTQEPTVLPSRFPNLLVNGVGRHRGRHGHQHPAAQPARGRGRRALGAREPRRSSRGAARGAHRSGSRDPTSRPAPRSSGSRASRMRTAPAAARSPCAPSSTSRSCRAAPAWSITELPYQVNPDNLALKIADLVKEGKVPGIADIRDETSGRTGQRLVIVLKRDAVAEGRAQQPATSTRSCRTTSARTCSRSSTASRARSRSTASSRSWIEHQIDVIVRRTAFRLRKAEERMHILRALPQGARRARRGHRAHPPQRRHATPRARASMKLLDIDDLQARAILDMQLRRLAALERQKIIDEATELEALIAELPAHPRRPRPSSGRSSSTSSTEIVDRVRRRPPHGDPRWASTAT